MKLGQLEALGQAYDSARQSNKALQTWKELYSLSIETGPKVVEAEAAFRIAEIDKSQKDVPNALNYYGISTQTWRSLQNNQQLSQALVSEALLLLQSGKGEEAIPLETEIAEMATKTQNRPLLFTSNVILAEIFQPSGKAQEARDVLEKAQTLIRPGPTDAEIDGTLVSELYLRLADVYKALHFPIKELVALKKAVVVLHSLKDDQSLQRTFAYLKGRMDALQVQDIAAKEGKPVESLWYSEILYVWTGVPAGTTQDENWNRVFSLPSQVIQQPDGPQALDEMLSAMGSLLGIARLPILDSLSNYFLTSDSKPVLAERYASEAQSIVKKQAPNPSDALLVRPVCQLTIAYAFQTGLGV